MKLPVIRAMRLPETCGDCDWCDRRRATAVCDATDDGRGGVPVNPDTPPGDFCPLRAALRRPDESSEEKAMKLPVIQTCGWCSEYIGSRAFGGKCLHPQAPESSAVRNASPPPWCPLRTGPDAERIAALEAENARMREAADAFLAWGRRVDLDGATLHGAALERLKSQVTESVRTGVAMSTEMTDNEILQETERRAWAWEQRCRELAAQVTRAASFGGLSYHREATEALAMAKSIQSTAPGELPRKRDRSGE